MPAWPRELWDVNSTAVAQKRADLSSSIEYQLFLQWLCEEQLAEVVAAIKAAGMKVGLYTDLALGSAWGGADSWIWRDCFCGEISCGAPPDEPKDLRSLSLDELTADIDQLETWSQICVRHLAA